MQYHATEGLLNVSFYMGYGDLENKDNLMVMVTTTTIGPIKSLKSTEHHIFTQYM
jgi:hypothetical protein